MRELLAKHPIKASHDERRRQRVAAGLTLRQAAKLLGIFPSDLSDYENCRSEPSAELCEAIAKVYGVGDP